MAPRAKIATKKAAAVAAVSMSLNMVQQAAGALQTSYSSGISCDYTKTFVEESNEIIAICQKATFDYQMNSEESAGSETQSGTFCERLTAVYDDVQSAAKAYAESADMKKRVHDGLVKGYNNPGDHHSNYKLRTQMVQIDHLEVSFPRCEGSQNEPGQGVTVPDMHIVAYYQLPKKNMDALLFEGFLESILENAEAGSATCTWGNPWRDIGSYRRQLNLQNPEEGKGLHEATSFYQACENRERNKGLYRNDNLEDNDTRPPLQNPGGDRRLDRSGQECPEERGYYPYWAPTPWKELAIVTNNLAMCENYKVNSQNVKGRGYCAGGDTNGNNNNLPIEEAACAAIKGQWTVVSDYGIAAPECVLAPVTRDNHLGNDHTGNEVMANLTIPAGAGCMNRRELQFEWMDRVREDANHRARRLQEAGPTNGTNNCETFLSAFDDWMTITMQLPVNGTDNSERRLSTSWTSQHSCGSENAECQIVIQYMCNGGAAAPEGLSACSHGPKNCALQLRYNITTADTRACQNPAHTTKKDCETAGSVWSAFYLDSNSDDNGINGPPLPGSTRNLKTSGSINLLNSASRRGLADSSVSAGTISDNLSYASYKATVIASQVTTPLDFMEAALERLDRRRTLQSSFTGRVRSLLSWARSLL